MSGGSTRMALPPAPPPAGRARAGPFGKAQCRTQLQADEEAFPAHARELFWELGRELRKLRDPRAAEFGDFLERLSRAMTSSTARPAAQASGVPPNVVHGCRGEQISEAVADPNRTNRKPTAQPLAMAMASGITPAYSNA